MTTWQPGVVPTQDPKTGGWGFIASPQPGTFDPTPPEANPVVFNQPTVAPNAGTPIVTTKDLTGKTLTVHGTVAGVTVNNPG